jgi:hypothetical protein
MGILLVFDLTDERSFNNIRNWIHNTEQYASEGVNKLLVGNKADMAERRAVSTERAQALAQEFGLQYMETSAKARLNVEEAFMQLARDIKKRLIDNVSSGDAGREKQGAAGSVRLEEEGGALDRVRATCCYGGGTPAPAAGAGAGAGAEARPRSGQQ